MDSVSGIVGDLLVRLGSVKSRLFTAARDALFARSTGS